MFCWVAVELSNLWVFVELLILLGVLIGNNGNISTTLFFFPLQDAHVGMAPEDEEAILALHFALRVGDRYLTKKSQNFKILALAAQMAFPLDLPLVAPQHC